MKNKKLKWGCLWLVSLLLASMFTPSITAFATDQTLQSASRKAASHLICLRFPRPQMNSNAQRK